MKKTGILHRELAGRIALLGHYDQIVLVSCLSSVPASVPLIDLALHRGVPTMEQVLRALLEEVCIEKAWVSTEMQQSNPDLWQQVNSDIAAVELVPNEVLKEKYREACVCIRTGEHRRFSNLVIQAGYLS